MVFGHGTRSHRAEPHGCEVVPARGYDAVSRNPVVVVVDFEALVIEPERPAVAVHELACPIGEHGVAKGGKDRELVKVKREEHAAIPKRHRYIS
jgi:hypothetical protein